MGLEIAGYSAETYTWGEEENRTASGLGVIFTLKRVCTPIWMIFRDAVNMSYTHKKPIQSCNPGEDMQMRRASDLIDLAKASKDAGSDYKVARHIDVTPQRLSDYRRERRFPSKKHIIALCELALEDPAFWVFQLEARKAKTARDAALYERVAANYA